MFQIIVWALKDDFSSIGSDCTSSLSWCVKRVTQQFNQHVTSGLFHPYHLDESTFILGAAG